MDGAGNLYGATAAGGNAACAGGCGVIYELSPSGTETVLHTFDGQDGYWPRFGVSRDAGGNLYGTTFYGGASATCTSGVGCGDVFEIASGGAFSVLHSFVADGTDGYYPLGDVSYSSSTGALYGTTEAGGTDGCGAEYSVTPSSGTERVLNSWPAALGCGPVGKLYLGSAGNIYGAYQDGGSSSYGGVFKIEPNGRIKILYAFNGGNDGKFPWGGPIEDGSGNLYGVTQGGGSYNCGVVYKISPTGVETILHTFTGLNGDGNGPLGQLVRDTKGNLFGVTEWGGANSEGIVYELSPTGVETILHTFTGNTDGGAPEGSLLRASSGKLYGTAGTTVFEIAP